MHCAAHRSQPSHHRQRTKQPLLPAFLMLQSILYQKYQHLYIFFLSHRCIHQNYFSDSRYSGAQVFYGAEQGSEVFAKSLQSMFVQSLNEGSNRQAKKASGVYLMEHIDCPGILVECGFISNVQEEAKLRSEEYQKNLCCVVAAATSRYLYSEAIA